MKKLLIALLMLMMLSIASFAQTQPSKPQDAVVANEGASMYGFNSVAEVERKLPSERAAQLRQASEQIQQRQREIEVLQLQARNIVLEAALELGLNKSQLEQMELAADSEGNLVFKPKPAPPQSPASARQAQPPNR